METTGNQFTASNQVVLNDDIVVLNIAGFSGYEDESFTIIRNSGRKNFEIPDDHNQALIEIPQDPSSAFSNRVKCAQINDIEGIPNGLYILCRLNEKPSQNAPSDVQESESTSIENAANVSTNNEYILEGESSGSTASKIPGLNYQDFLSLLQSFNNPESFSFHEVKSYLHSNDFPVNSKQLTYFLFRAVNRRVIEVIGKKIYKMRMVQPD